MAAQHSHNVHHGCPSSEAPNESATTVAGQRVHSLSVSMVVGLPRA